MIEVLSGGRRASIPFSRIVFFQETDSGTTFCLEGNIWLNSETPYAEVCAAVTTMFSCWEGEDDDNEKSL